MTPEEAGRLEKRLEKRGYYFNPDRSLTDPLLESLQVNEKRYGYPFCPCRLASGDNEQDRDAVCPCDYRDQDVYEYGTCYCGLYVSREVAMTQKAVGSIPERRGTPPSPNQIWRCDVCGYICVRPTPPDICPVCGVTRDRFHTVEL
jgi:ferredoxin-thioredoxin reductase catalytic chain